MRLQHLGELLTNGAPAASAAPAPSDPEPSPSADFAAIALPGSISIGAMDLKAEYVAVCNNSSSEVSLDGWSLHSARGQQKLLFPSDVLLKRGEQLVVRSGPRSHSRGDTAGVQNLVWSGRNVWNGAPWRSRTYHSCCLV